MARDLSAVDRAGHERDERLEAGHRVRRGIVHTPSALARWIVGRCGPVPGSVTLVDPACGPGVFLEAALTELPFRPERTLGIDVDPDAISLARRELAPLYSRAGWPLELQAQDALDAVPTVPGAAIVVGNPPWTARTASRGVTDALLDDFRRDAGGAPLRERKIGVLSDAYVRFIRWATAVVERAPEGGVVAMVVNGSFLDGRVHRAMRSYLASAFDRIELLDLGGSGLVARGGERDENVFGVRPGVVVFVGHRSAGAHARTGVLRSMRLRGSRVDKLEALAALAEGDGRFRSIAPAAPLFRFVPAPSRPLPTSWPTIDAWMPWNREGVQTNRDAWCVDVDRAVLLARVGAFVEHPDASLARGHFDPVEAAARLRAEAEPLERFVVPIAYRPLDPRWLFAHPALCHRARPELGAALEHAPLALITASKDRGDRPFAHLGVVSTIADNCWLSSRSSCRARLFPLCTPEGEQNVGPEVRTRLPGPVRARDVLAYLAAWLGAPSYRARFDESLRAGPIRVPLPRTADELARGVAAGERIITAFLGAHDAIAPAPLVIGHHHLAPSPRAAAVAAAQHAADELVRDLVGSAA